MMASLLGFDAHLPYAERCEAMTQAGIAVWDVLAAAERPGSLDADIKRDTVTANPLAEWVAALPDLQCIAFNGQAAAKLFKRHVPVPASSPLASLPTYVMPSTSPAYAAMKPDEKRARWATLLSHLKCKV